MITIGIDLGGMSAKAACLAAGALTEKARVVTSKEKTPEETAKDLAALAREAAARGGIAFDEIDAVGVGSPGVIDGGVVVQWSNFGWKDVKLAALLSEILKKPTFVLNDANAAALGEAKYGAGVKYDDCALVTIGTGVGSGIVLGGKLFTGYRGAGTELGHTVIRAGGLPCPCGRRGCFEQYASATALIRRTRESMEQDRASRLWEIAKTTNDVDGTTAFRAASMGDAAARETLDGYLEDLAEGIADLVNLMRPQAVILGGGISAEGEALLDPLRKKVNEKLYIPAERVPFQIVAATLGNDAGIYGAAHYASECVK